MVGAESLSRICHRQWIVRIVQLIKDADVFRVIGHRHEIKRTVATYHLAKEVNRLALGKVVGVIRHAIREA